MTIVGGILVTGGSGGIGAAVCRAVAKQGGVPWIGYATNRDKAEQLADETQGHALPLDMREPDTFDAALTQIADTGATIKGVVLAAARAPTVLPFGKIASDEALDQWRVGVEGPRLLLAQVIKRFFRKSMTGSVVAVLSEAMGDADHPAAKSMSSYVIAKYGLLGVMKAVAAECPWLRTATVSPGYTETEMLKAFEPRYLDSLRQQQPGGTFASPDQWAEKIVRALEAEDD